MPVLLDEGLQTSLNAGWREPGSHRWMLLVKTGAQAPEEVLGWSRRSSGPCQLFWNHSRSGHAGWQERLWKRASCCIREEAGTFSHQSATEFCGACRTLLLALL